MNLLFWRIGVRRLCFGKPGRDSVVRPVVEVTPPHQVGCTDWWRGSSERLFCQRGGALEGLVGPCEAGGRTGGRPIGPTGRKRPGAIPPARWGVA